VAFLITGGNPELLWLDEPLTAQDKDRRSAILSMIRKLPINQILMINHAQEAQDIVDYEITLKKGD
jgi:energy-coupling factor transporter ATP-binding protein EcfA2